MGWKVGIIHKEVSIVVEMSKMAYVLVLIGGILLFIFGLLDILGYAVSGIPSPSLLPIRGLNYGIVELICGVIAIIGAKHAIVLGWAVVLIVVGIFGGGLGGLLVILGGIIGLIVAITGDEKA